MGDNIELLEKTAGDSKPKNELPPAQRFKRLFALAKGEGKILVVATIAMGLSSGVTLLVPDFIGKVIDAATQVEEEEGKKMLARSVVSLFVIFALGAFFTFVRASLFTISGERVVARLRRLLFARIINQEIAFFDTNRVGELINRLSSDCQVLQNAVTVNVSMFLRNMVQLIAAMVILFSISWKLTVVMLMVVPPLALGAVRYGKYVKKVSKEVQDALATSTVVAEETIGNIRTVRSFAKEEKQVENYDKAVDHAFVLSKRRAIAFGAFSGGAFLFGNAALALVLWFGGSLVLSHEMSIGTLTGFVLYTVWVAVALATLSSLFNDFMKALGATSRVFELLDREPSIPIEGGDRPADMSGHVLLRDVVFQYPTRDVPILKGLNLELKPSHVVALVGPSGSGKSTVCSLVCRFYDPTEGEILVDGRLMSTLDPKWLRSHMALVMQEPVLFAASLMENVSYGVATADARSVQRACEQANIWTFIETLKDGLSTTVGERGVRLSGGQKQRVAIARAVLMDPKILVLDEATSALDSESEQLVQDALERLMQHRTVLVIAHRLSTVKKANSLCVMDDGRIVEQGTHTELIAREDGLYRRLVERQLLDGAKAVEEHAEIRASSAVLVAITPGDESC